MPYVKVLPEWKTAGTKPPQAKIDGGWAPGDKPPAAWWNWWMYTSYYALQELQLSSVHSEKLGAASGVATLGSDSKLTASQLPAIGSAQITDGSITNNDLATDAKVGSLATLTTTAKTSVTAAINEVKASDDLKIPLTQKAAANGVASLGADSKLTGSQLPVVPTANIADLAVTDAKLAADNKVGSLASLVTTAKGSVVLAINEIENDFNSHMADAIRHITGQERATWNASQLKKLTESNGYSISITNADLNTVKDTGFYYGSSMTNAPNGTGTGWVLVHAVNSSYLTQEFVVNTNSAAGNRKFWRVFFNGVWNDWNEVASTEFVQSRIDLHAADAVKHLSPAERAAWNAKAETTPVTITVNGLMLATDKVKLNGISTGANKVLNTANNGEISIDGVPAQVYTHPTTHPATMIVEDSGHRFLTDAEKAAYAAKETPAGAQAKADAAEVDAKNASVPRNDTRVNSADLNTYTTTQVTAIGSPVTNGPAGFAYGSIMVAASATDRVTQLVFDSGGKKMWTRYATGAPLVWTSWIDLATSAVATASVAGLMSAADFTKLTGIATNANNYSHPTGDGNSHVPATGTTNAGKFLEAGATANSASWQFIDWTDIVNKPSTYAPSAHGHAIADVTGLQTALDGKSATSHTHADATTTLSGFFAAADKVKLNGISTGANKTTSSATNGNIAIDGSQVTVYTHPATHPATMIVEDSGHRFATDAEKNIWNAKASTAVATGSANGLMSAADFTKLAGVSTGANKVTNPATNGVIAIDGANTTVYAHPTGDGNSHVPATGTSSNGKFLKAASAANSASWQFMTIADISGLQTQLDAPQKYKLTQDTGNGKVVSGGNLNTVLQPGTYSIPRNSGYTNRPFNSNDLAVLIVEGQDTTGNTIQRFTNLENDWVGKTYTRVCLGGVWTEWKQELQSGDAQMAKLVDDFGFTQSITGYDLDVLLNSGFYYGNNLVNNPSGTTVYHRVWVMMSDPTSGIQMAWTNAGRFYTRFLVGGSWSPWNVVFTPNNIQTGGLSIVPSAPNTPTGVTVTFATPFKGTPSVQITALTTVPGTSVTGVSVGNITPTGFTAYLTRTNTGSTGLTWTAVYTEQ